MSTLKTINVIHPSGTTNNIVNDASGNVTVGGKITSSTVTSAAGTALTIQSAGTTAMTIDTSQNVGIGTASPGVKLDINGQRVRVGNASDPGLELSNAVTTKGYVFYDTTNDVVTMRHASTGTGVSINSSGNALVGVTSQVGIGGQLQISGANAIGGAGYNTFLTVQNTTSGATNTKKYFRLSSTGGLEVINDAYTAAILVLDNSGILSFNSGYGSAAPAYGCRAWVNFNGDTSPGTINASANVSSVTRPATGTYTISFTSAMPDANYSTVGTCVGENNANGRGPVEISGPTRPTTSAVQVLTCAAQNVSVPRNSPLVCVAVFR